LMPEQLLIPFLFDWYYLCNCHYNLGVQSI
jgi:hypothetical protein